MKKEQAAKIADSINHLILTKDMEQFIINGGPDQVIIHTYVGITCPFESKWTAVRQEIEIFDGEAHSVRYKYQEGEWKLFEEPMEFFGEIVVIQKDVYECL